MNELRYTLIGDGSSDKRLIPVLNWLLQRHSFRRIAATWADFSVLRESPRTLSAKVAAAIELYPSDLLFVHRDAETAPRTQRISEIVDACLPYPNQPIVAVIPIRMQEAWLLISEEAIRTAAGRPRGRVPLNLPALSSLEAQPDPKQTLYDALEMASEHRGRHLRRFKASAAAYRVSEIIEDYAPLCGLSAFRDLENDVLSVLRERNLM